MLLAMLCAGAPLGLMGIDHVLAGQDAARPSVNLPSGEVVANSANGLQIDGKVYQLHPSVMVQDDEGRPHQVKDVVPGMFVKYHLKGEQIDQLIILLPR
jgi:hypothetical protein